MIKLHSRIEEDYYECPRCERGSLDKQMTPCPRGGCEAVIKGTVIKTIEVNTELTEDQKKWNKTR